MEGNRLQPSALHARYLRSWKSARCTDPSASISTNCRQLPAQPARHSATFLVLDAHGDAGVGDPTVTRMALDDTAIRDWLAREIQRRQLSQRMLATRSGVNHSTISRLLNSSRAPSWSTVVRLSAALGTAPPTFGHAPAGATDAQIRRALLAVGLAPHDIDEMVAVYRRREMRRMKTG